MPYTIYSKPHCPFCRYAEDFLRNRGELFNTIDITLDMEALTFIKDVMNLKTVPVVFDNTSSLIGGYEDLVEHFRKIDQKNFSDQMF